MRPHFSILIQIDPTDSLEQVSRLMRGLRFSLTRDDVECLALVQGHSDHPVLPLLRAEGGIQRVIRWGDDQGAGAGWAALVEHSRGRLVALLGAGASICESRWLDQMGQGLKRRGLGLCAAAGAVIAPDWSGLTPLGRSEHLRLIDVPLGEGALLRRETALEAGFERAADSGASNLNTFWAEMGLWVRAAGYEAAQIGGDPPLRVGTSCLRLPPHLIERWRGRGLNLGGRIDVTSGDGFIDQPLAGLVRGWHQRSHHRGDQLLVKRSASSDAGSAQHHPDGLASDPSFWERDCLPILDPHRA